MDFIISGIGLALVAAPWLFGYHSNSTAMTTSVGLGLIIAVVAGYRAFTKDTRRWEEWIVVIAGLLAIAAPFIFGFAAPALWSFVIFGVFAAGMAGYQAFTGGPSTPIRRT